MKNSRIANNVIAEFHTQECEYVLFNDYVKETFAITVRRNGELGKTVFEDKSFGVAGREFLKRIDLDKAHCEYMESEK